VPQIIFRVNWVLIRNWTFLTFCVDWTFAWNKNIWSFYWERSKFQLRIFDDVLYCESEGTSHTFGMGVRSYTKWLRLYNEHLSSHRSYMNVRALLSERSSVVISDDWSLSTYDLSPINTNTLPFILCISNPWSWCYSVESVPIRIDMREAFSPIPQNPKAANNPNFVLHHSIIPMRLW
jgi:hypothetical protein